MTARYPGHLISRPQIRKVLEKKFRSNPNRARELEDARKHRDGVLKPADYWAPP